MPRKNTETIRSIYNIYSSNQKSNPSVFQFAEPNEIIELSKTNFELLATFDPIIEVLEDQRDRNITHLDLKHIKQPEWRENQIKLDLSQVENLYQELIIVMKTYYKLFFNKDLGVEYWSNTSQKEIETLIDFYNSYISKN